MPEPAINYSAGITAIDRMYRDIKGLQEVSFDFSETGSIKIQAPLLLWAMNIARSCEDAIDNADPDEISWTLNRTFFKNNGANNIRIRISGWYYTLKAGSSYACHPSEWMLIDEHYNDDGDLDLVNVAEYINSGDTDHTVFYS